MSRVGWRFQCPTCGKELVQKGSGWRCLGCGASYPLADGIPILMPTELGTGEAVKAFFDGVAGDVSAENLSYVPFQAPQLDAHLRILANAYDRSLMRWINDGATVLDVGCGHGALLEHVATRYRIAGVDFAFEMLSFARRRGYDVYQGDAARLPFDSNQFDAVICAEVFQHFEDLRRILSELVRVARPGASIVVSTLNATSVLRFLIRMMRRALRPSSFALPILRRTPDNVLASFTPGSVELREIAWVASPLHAVAYGRDPASTWAPFATNFIMCLTKTAT